MRYSQAFRRIIMRKIFVVLSVLCAVGFGQVRLAAACEKCGSSAIQVINGFANPESVARDPSGKIFYVSNLGVKLDPSGKDGDGFISAVSAEGKILAHKQFPKTSKLNAPKGMAVVGNTLYVADIDRIVGFDLATRAQVFESSLASTKTKFLNDVVAVSEHTLLVSATDLGKIYSVDLARKDDFSVYADLPGANGLYRAGSKNYAVSFGAGMNLQGGFGSISGHQKGRYHSLSGTTMGGFDGIFEHNHRLYMTDWVAFGKDGAIRVYDLKKKQLSVLKTGFVLKGPADFLYDGASNRVWLPTMMSGQVYVFPLR
jgi:hypothetical protein